ncbi:MAG TPA: Crp/Fnr family transcriptional regulator [Solirubrobacteraceae bacterium]|nr:Crp/Fnr family transcriptional regulator [Solirubrobacteraceae bacterium]
MAHRPAISLLDAMPELGDDLPAEEYEAARRTLKTPERELEPGRWQPDAITLRPTMGLLVTEGLLTRTVGLIGRTATELLGPGDVLRPWEDEAPDAGPVRLEVSWCVLDRATLALLDRRLVAAAAHWPEVVGALSRRAVSRSHRLMLQLACSHLPRLDDRLLVLFWHLAERWGRVGPGGVLVPLRLTHRTLADLVGARRPSVTAALGDLSRRGLITRAGDGWVLQGDPSEPLLLAGAAHAPSSFSAP